MALRELLAFFFVDTSQVTAGIDKAEKKVDGFEGVLKKAGAAIAGAFAVNSIVSFTAELIHTADATAKAADALGLGVLELQEWSHAADLSGVQAELLRASVSKLQLQLNEAATKGAGPAAEALRALGLEAKDSEGKLKTSGRIIEEVADAIQGMDIAERNVQLVKLFGEQGIKLVPMLKGGSKAIREMRAEVEALGFAFDEDFARNAEKFDDNVDRLKKGLRGFVVQGLGPILPDLIDLTGQMVAGTKAVIPYIRGFIRFTRETRFLQAALAMLGFKGFVFGTVKLAGFVKGLGGLRGMLTRLIALTWRWLAPLLLIEDFFVFMSGGKSAIGKTLDKVFGDGTADKLREQVSELAGSFKELISTKESIILWGAAVAAAFGPIAKTVKGMSKLAKVLGLGGKAASAARGAAAGAGSAAAGAGVAAGLAGTALYGSSAILAYNVATNKPTEGTYGIGSSRNWKAGEKTAGEHLSDAQRSTDIAKIQASLFGEKVGQVLAADIDASVAKANGKKPGAAGSSSPLGPQAITIPAPVQQTVKQDIHNTTHVSVTVPEGTEADMARRVGNAAASGAARGSANNLRATQDALVPAPPG